MSINKRWPNWRMEINRQIEGTIDRLSQRDSSDGGLVRLQILSNQETILKALFWIIEQSKK